MQGSCWPLLLTLNLELSEPDDNCYSLSLNITQKIQLVGDIDQFLGFDLAVPLGDPGLKAAAGQFRVTVQGPADGVDDEVEKVSLIPGIAVRAGKDHPIGAARGDQAGPRLLETPEESAPGATAARGPALASARVHGAVIQGFDQ